MRGFTGGCGSLLEFSFVEMLYLFIGLALGLEGSAHETLIKIKSKIKH